MVLAVLTRQAVAAGFRSQVVACGHQSLHVRTWPGDHTRTVVMWHGITGTGLDHLEFAERLSAEGYRVVAPDSLGCGTSDWATDASKGYGLAALTDMAIALLDALGIDCAFWLGFSKGGSLGLRLAAEMPERIRALVLCDVGPGLPEAFRGALANRLAAPPTFSDLGAFRAHISRLLIRAGVDPCTPILDRLTIAWSRRLSNGGVGYHYDSSLSQQFLTCPEDFDLWDTWARIACPTLVLRGEHSDVLSEQELEAMLRHNIAASCAVLAGSGHLNFLDDPEHQNILIAFLESTAR